MAASRRRFIQRAGVIASAAATEPLRTAGQTQAAQAAATPPPLAVIALNRMGYGPRPGDITAFNGLGATDADRLAAYVEQQLNPGAIDDSACDSVLTAARLKIRYDADSQNRYPAKNEARPLEALGKGTAELWPLANFNTPMAFAERIRPFDEVRVATWIRAVHSKRQLQEVLADFWHNHFNVNGSSESQIYTTFPVYDRDVIRKNMLGNFRTFLEDVAKSTAMLYSLDNYNNKVSGGEGGNENYARELFELHTLGSDNYLKFYDDRSLVGTIEYGGKTYPRGYIDKDVYEAASCLTGWSVRNNEPRDKSVGNDGTFVFKDFWHYTGVKIVLSQVIDFGDTRDAQTVFTLLAGHPGTARHVCRKLCRRFIGDTPPETVVEAAVATWMAALDAPDQLRQVVRTILLSEEFKATWGEKVKRPFDAVVSYLRATDATLPVDTIIPDKPNEGGYWGSLFNNMSGTGHRIFEWPTPTGYPDLASYWVSTNSTLRRWNLPYILTQSWGGNIRIPVVEQTDLASSCTAIVDAWISRLFGYPIDTTVRAELITFLAQGGNPDAAPTPTAKAPDWGKPEGVQDRVKATVQLLAASPDYHAR